jgi:hypothetical protein
MKKLTLLVALLLCVTIGGVYATWIFAGDSILSQTDPFANKMGDVDTTTSAGAYHFTNNTMAIVVEPDSNDTHNTTLTWDASGSVTLRFEANSTISDAPLDKALRAVITVEAVDIANAKYNDGTGEKQIYSLNPDFKITLTEGDWTQESTYVYTYTVSAAQLADAVTMESFNLPNYDAYRSFKTAQDIVKFKFRVSPGV